MGKGLSHSREPPGSTGASYIQIYSMLQQFHSKANTRASQSVTESYQEHSRMSLYTLKEENFWLVKMLKKKKKHGGNVSVIMSRNQETHRMLTEPPQRVPWTVSGTTCQAHIKNSMNECGQVLLLGTVMLWDLEQSLHFPHSPFII